MCHRYREHHGNGMVMGGSWASWSSIEILFPFIPYFNLLMNKRVKVPFEHLTHFVITSAFIFIPTTPPLIPYHLCFALRITAHGPVGRVLALSQQCSS